MKWLEKTRGGLGGGLVVAAMVAALGWWAIGAESAARAQEAVVISDEDEANGDGDTMEMYEQWRGRSLSPKDIDRLTKMLSLTDEQKSTVKDLLDAYQAKVDDARAKISEFQKALADKHGGAAMGMDTDYAKEIGKAYEKYEKHQEKLRDGMVSDIQAVLSDDQQAKWEGVDRWMRRGKQLARTFGLTGAGRIDLVSLVETTYGETPVPEAITQTLDQYSVEMDRVLKDHEAYQKQMQDDLGWSNKDNDKKSMAERMEDQRKVMAKMIEQAKAQREINVRQMKRITGMIDSEEKRAEFEAEFYKRTASPFMGMRQPKDTLARAVRAVKKLDDLTSEQKTKLEEIEKSVRAERLKMDIKTFDEACKKEDDVIAAGSFDWSTMWGGMMDQGSGKSELETRTVSQLRDMLTAAQLEKLPAPFNTPDVPKVEFEE